MKPFILALCGLLSVAGTGERVGHESEIENSTPNQLEDLADKIVVFEGIAWGDKWPGLGRRIVLGTGARLYLEEKELALDFPNGRLVRVHGRLHRQHRSAARGIQAGYDRSFGYWAVEQPKIEVIAKIDTDAVEEYIDPQASRVPRVDGR